LKALLELEGGKVFEGVCDFGGSGTYEVVFNTSMTGTTEVITDPASAGQALLFTYPLIGNSGVCFEDFQSAKPQIAALIVSRLSEMESNFRSEESLKAVLERNGIPIITGVDTRSMVRLLRQLTVDNEQLTVDLLIGDFDTLKKIPDNVEAIRHPSEKNESDLELAVEEAIRRGFNCFYIYGCLGGRLDHSLASIAVLASISRRGMTGWLIGVNEVITAVTDSKITLDSHESGFVSIFPAGETAKGVTLTGLKYPLCNAVLTCVNSLGLSNEFMGVEAVVEVRDGTLIIIAGL